MREGFELNSPFLSLTFDDTPDRWLLISTAWFMFWGVVTMAMVYGYAVLAANWIGFETTLLVGIALIAVQLSGDK